MKSIQQAIAIAAVVSLMAIPLDANAAGSWGGSSGGSAGGSAGGGYASSGGGSSGGGGFFARLRARHSGGSVGNASAGSSGGSYAASYASSGGGSVGGSVGGSSGGASRVGPLRRLVAKIHARKAARRSAGSRGGSSGGSSGGGVSYARYSGGSNGGSSGGVASTSYASSYSAPAAHSVSMGSTASYESPVIESSYESYTPMGETVIDGGYNTDSGYSTGETILDSGYDSGESIIDYGASNSVGSSSKVVASTVGYKTESAQRHESTKPAIDPDSAMLTVKVPFEAVVTVNDHDTESDGSVRQFMSRGLKEGYSYTYVVKVVYDVEGKTKTDSKSVVLRPGDIEQVEFDMPQSAASDSVQARKVPASDDVTGEDLVTVVQLHVPAEAKVSLAGNETSGSGPVRTFRTKQLKAGQQWTDYTVRVTAKVDGQSITKERTVNVEAGSVTELHFDFDDNAIAVR